MNLIEVGEGKKEGGEEEEEGTGDRGCKLRKSGEAVSLSLSLSPLDHVVSRIRWPSFFFFFTHDFSLFADTTLLTPQGTECAPITCIEKVNLSDFFEKLPYTYTSKCKLCGRIVSNLKNHYLTHNPGNYVCPLCGCRRTRLDNLKGHIKQKHPEIQILQKSSGSGQT